MKTKLGKTTRILAAFALLGAIIACGGNDDEDDQNTESQGVAAAQPGATPGGPPQDLQLGQPPASIQVPVPPSFNLAITEHGEYQIDAVASGMDPELFVYQGDSLVEQNDNGGDQLNGRVVRFLPPGTYSVRVVEHRARAMTAQVQAQRLQPLTPAGALTLGAPLAVAFPAYPLLSRPSNDRDASKEVTLTIAAAGQYTCSASADGTNDAKMSIILNGEVLQEDDDSGEGNTAQITRQLAPGTYQVRVWDWLRRGNMNITVTCRQG